MFAHLSIVPHLSASSAELTQPAAASQIIESERAAEIGAEVLGECDGDIDQQ
jgi:hypothetical protein